VRIHLIPNSHIDPVWLWDKYEGIDEVLNTFRSACDRLDEYPNPTFSASSIQFYEWVLQHDAALFKRIQQKVTEGHRLRLTLIRSSLYGYDQHTPLNPIDPQNLTDQGEHRFRLCLSTTQDFNEDQFDQLSQAFVEPYLVIREG
jgi:hypothetical protein